MQISVVIPAYNAANCIAKAIKSCKRQSLPPLEIIVVLDACTDHTESLVRQAFPEVNLIMLSENKGPSFARNKGMNTAQGEWVCFLDADDEWHPDKLKIISYYVAQQTNVTCLFHPFSLKEQKAISFPPKERLNKISFFNILFQNKAQGSCICLKKEAHITFNESFRFCEDHELLVRQSWLGGVFQIPIALTKLGREQLSFGGLSGNRWNMRKGEIKIYTNIWHQSILFLPIIPVLIFFSLMKHLRSQLLHQRP